jgi:uncharacterized membrane protein
MSAPVHDNGPGSGPSDHAVEQVIGRLLQLGVFVAAAVAIAGAILVLIQHGSASPAFRDFQAAPWYLTSVGGILRGVREMRSESIVQLGIVLLIATPILRVAFTLVAFVLQKDRVYIAITTLVLALLVYGLAFGRVGH